MLNSLLYSFVAAAWAAMTLLICPFTFIWSYLREQPSALYLAALDSFYPWWLGRVDDFNHARDMWGSKT